MRICVRGGLMPVALAAAVSVGTLTATAAADDIVLKSSTPKNGATVARPPTTIRLTFSVKPSKPKVKVISPDGDNHAKSAKVVGRTVIVRMRAGEEGTYKVTYKVSSPDGDAKSGNLSFKVR